MPSGLRSCGLPVLLLSCSMAAPAQPGPADSAAVDTISAGGIGRRVHENRGRVTLVNVWATWCEPCRKEIPGLVKLRKAYAARGLDLLLVSADDQELQATEVPRTLRRLGVDFPTYMRCDSTDDAFIDRMSTKWSGALPATFLYDREGQLAEIIVGGRSYEQFEKSVKRLLGD